MVRCWIVGAGPQTFLQTRWRTLRKKSLWRPFADWMGLMVDVPTPPFGVGCGRSHAAGSSIFIVAAKASVLRQEDRLRMLTCNLSSIRFRSTTRRNRTTPQLFCIERSNRFAVNSPIRRGTYSGGPRSSDTQQMRSVTSTESPQLPSDKPRVASCADCENNLASCNASLNQTL